MAAEPPTKRRKLLKRSYHESRQNSNGMGNNDEKEDTSTTSVKSRYTLNGVKSQLRGMSKKKLKELILTTCRNNSQVLNMIGCTLEQMASVVDVDDIFSKHYSEYENLDGKEYSFGMPSAYDGGMNQALKQIDQLVQNGQISSAINGMIKLAQETPEWDMWDDSYGIAGEACKKFEKALLKLFQMPNLINQENKNEFENLLDEIQSNWKYHEDYGIDLYSQCYPVLEKLLQAS